MKKLSYLLFITFILLLISCRKECQIAGNYAFVIPAQLNTDKDTVRIGDTLTLTSSFSNEVYERNSDKTYDLEDFKFYPYATMTRIDTVDKPGDFSEFEVLLDSNNYEFYFFSFSDGVRSLVGEYNYSAGQYDLAYQFIPKSKGLFIFCHSSVIYNLDRNQDFDGKCDRRSIDVHFRLNNDADNNVNLLRDSPDSYYSDWVLIDPQARFHDPGCYCFYVKE